MGDAKGRVSSDDTKAALYATTQAVERELGDAAWAAYRLGDDVQRGALDIAFDAVGLSWGRLLSRLPVWLRDVQEGAAAIGTERAIDLLVQQTRNNFEVYDLVKNVRSRLAIDPDRPVNLVALVEDAYGMGAYAGLWALEGLGHDYADFQLGRMGTSEGILCDGPAAALPASSLSMMHAGLGLALAERLLPQLNPWSSRADTARVIGDYIDACAANGRPGYRGAAYESLGLVARTWFPQVVGRIDEVLHACDERLAGYFWHGAGRALYFLPQYIVPVLSPWRAADREAPHALARDNLHAGLAWASTLVNIRQPQILGDLLDRRRDPAAPAGALVNGIASALIVALAVTPGDSFVRAFADYEPAGSSTAAAWNELAAPAAREALSGYGGVIRDCGALGGVFRCRDLEAFACQLSARAAEPPGPARAHTRRQLVVPPADRRPGLYPSSSTSQNRRA